MSRRTERLASLIQQELATMILRDLDDPRLVGFPTVTRVTVADDLATADVFVTIMGTPGQQTAALNALKHSAGLMRAKLSKSLSTRTTPFLRFQIDEELRRELGVLSLLDKVNQEKEEMDARAAKLQAEQAAEEAEYAARQAARAAAEALLAPESVPADVAETPQQPSDTAGGRSPAAGA